MAKTALELTRQEWQAYRPGATGQQLGRKPDPGLHLRRQQAWRVARKAAKVLRGKIAWSVSYSLAHWPIVAGSRRGPTLTWRPGACLPSASIKQLPQ